MSFKSVVSMSLNGNILIITATSQHTITPSHVKYNELRDLMHSGDKNSLEALTSSVDQWIDKNMVIQKDGSIFVMNGDNKYTVPLSHMNYSELASVIENKDTLKIMEWIKTVDQWINNKKLNYSATVNTITLQEDDGEVIIIGRFDRRFKKIEEALKENKFEVVRGLMSPEKAVEFMEDDNFKMTNGVMYYKNEELPTVISRRVKEMATKGMDLTPILKFWEKLTRNPSFNSRQQLFGFLEANNIPLSEDGNFIAYKKVTGDYKDIHTKTIDNTIGTVVKLDRAKVDDNPNNTCSSGLHICSYDYLQHFGSNTTDSDKVLLCSINPEHMVSVPTDYNNSKARVCEYTVIGELPMPKPLNKIVYERDEEFHTNDPVDETDVQEQVEDETDTMYEHQNGYSLDDKDTVIGYFNDFSHRYEKEALVSRILEECENEGYNDLDEETIEQILVDNGHWSWTRTDDSQSGG